jgi:hypothetical protein
MLLLSALGFLLAMGLLAAARFSVRPAMTYRTWWVALVATELGHVGLLLAVGLACGMTWIALRAADGVAVGLAVGATTQALIAAVLFAWPVVAAWRMSRRVAAEIDSTFFTAGTPTGKLWSWRRLWRWPNSVERGAVETFFAGETETELTPSAGLPIDFYRARAPANSASSGGDLSVPSVCVVVVHGGGWDSGDRAQLAAFNHWLAARGVAVAEGRWLTGARLGCGCDSACAYFGAGVGMGRGRQKNIFTRNSTYGGFGRQRRTRLWRINVVGIAWQ